MICFCVIIIIIMVIITDNQLQQTVPSGQSEQIRLKERRDLETESSDFFCFLHLMHVYLL